MSEEIATYVYTFPASVAWATLDFPSILLPWRTKNSLRQIIIPNHPYASFLTAQRRPNERRRRKAGVDRTFSCMRKMAITCWISP